MKTNPIDANLIKSLLEYEPSIGGSCLLWKIDRGPQGKAGARAGTLHHTGYWYVMVNKKKYKAHRLIYAMFYEADPKCCVDHINGDESDNRIENLRLAPRDQKDNQQNRKKQKNNTSGFHGVSKHSQTGKWRARLHVDRKEVHLGLFDTPEEAYKAYLKAKAELHTFNPTSR